jgi:hypothetical protein
MLDRELRREIVVGLVFNAFICPPIAVIGAYLSRPRLEQLATAVAVNDLSKIEPPHPPPRGIVAGTGS